MKYGKILAPLMLVLSTNISFAYIPDPQKSIEYITTYQCFIDRIIPPLETATINKIDVSVKYKEKNNNNVKEMQIIHYFSTGETINRAEHYINAHVYQPDLDNKDVSWEGDYIKDTSIHMKGNLIFEQQPLFNGYYGNFYDRIYYEEILTEEGEPTFFMHSVCIENAKE